MHASGEKNHFVSKFYLKGFVDPASHKSPNPYLWVADLQNQTVKRRGPEKVAAITGFYDWKEIEGEVPSVEELFSYIESKAAPIISRIRENDFRIMTYEDRYFLSNFIGLQITRVPSSRRIMDNRMRSFVQDWFRELVQDEERLRAQFERSAIEDVRGFAENIKSGELRGKDKKNTITMRLR